MKRIVMFVLTLIPFTLFAQDSRDIRICTYNVLHLGDNDVDRADAFRHILDAVRPDILVCQEVDNEAGLAFLIDSACIPAGLRAMRFVPFNDGPDTDNGLLYNADVVEFLSARYHATPLRDIAEYRILPRGTTDTTVVFSVHLKAGNNTEDEEQRADESALLVEVLRGISSEWNVALLGDLNVYSASERAYTLLTTPPSKIAGGESIPFLYDPISASGDWDGNPDFAAVHTQSTRGRQFGGGVRGGMDSRFDFILVSATMLEHVVPGSYTAFGNDGNHFNDSINAGTNGAVSPDVAQALHDASDHLPVYLDIRFKNVVSGVEERRRGPMIFGIW